MRLFEGTEFDRPPRCERCGELEADCGCPPEPLPLIAPEKQTAHIAVEKRKKGKVVTVIRGLPGAGGAIKDESIEIQGRQLDRVRDVLQNIGYRVKG